MSTFGTESKAITDTTTGLISSLAKIPPNFSQQSPRLQLLIRIYHALMTIKKKNSGKTLRSSYRWSKWSRAPKLSGVWSVHLTPALRKLLLADLDGKFLLEELNEDQQRLNKSQSCIANVSHTPNCVCLGHTAHFQATAWVKTEGDKNAKQARVEEFNAVTRVMGGIQSHAFSFRFCIYLPNGFLANKDTVSIIRSIGPTTKRCASC